METDNIEQKIITTAQSINPSEAWVLKQKDLIFSKNITHQNPNRIKDISIFFTNFFMKNKTIAYISISSITLLLTGMGLVLAANNSIPGDFLYGLDKSLENVQLAWAGSTGGSSAKAQTYLDLAEERVTEMRVIIGDQTTASIVGKVKAEDTTTSDLNGEQTKEVEDLAKDYEDDIDNAVTEVNKTKDEGKNVDELVIKVGDATLKHIEVLQRVYDKVPEQAKDSILKAMQKSMNGHDNALKAVSGEKKLELQARWQAKRDSIQQKLSDKKNQVPTKKGSNGGPKN